MNGISLYDIKKTNTYSVTVNYSLTCSKENGISNASYLANCTKEFTHITITTNR